MVGAIWGLWAGEFSRCTHSHTRRRCSTSGAHGGVVATPRVCFSSAAGAAPARPCVRPRVSGQLGPTSEPSRLPTNASPNLPFPPRPQYYLKATSPHFVSFAPMHCSVWSASSAKIATRQTTKRRTRAGDAGQVRSGRTSAVPGRGRPRMHQFRPRKTNIAVSTNGGRSTLLRLSSRCGMSNGCISQQFCQSGQSDDSSEECGNKEREPGEIQSKRCIRIRRQFTGMWLSQIAASLKMVSKSHGKCSPNAEL